MGDLTTDSDRLIYEGRQLLDDNRTGGRHRLAKPIGEGSRKLRNRHYRMKLRNIALASAGIFAFAVAAGLIIDGIGFAGLVITFFALVAAGLIFGTFPRMKVPQRADINRGTVQQMVGRTELWLEAQRPALPPPAAKIVDGIGVQLDALGLQLEDLDQNTPQAVEVRKLVGEHLPEMVASYRKIPAHLRSEKRADGRSPDQQLTDSLGKISTEIDGITRQLAEGNLDALAVRDRFLEYRYGNPEEPVKDADASGGN